MTDESIALRIWIISIISELKYQLIEQAKPFLNISNDSFNFTVPFNIVVT